MQLRCSCPDDSACTRVRHHRVLEDADSITSPSGCRGGAAHMTAVWDSRRSTKANSWRTTALGRRDLRRLLDVSMLCNCCGAICGALGIREAILMKLEGVYTCNCGVEIAIDARRLHLRRRLPPAWAASACLIDFNVDSDKAVVLLARGAPISGLTATSAVEVNNKLVLGAKYRGLVRHRRVPARPTKMPGP
jgi:hypothetical protein